MSFTETVLLGTIAGFTIFLGLPLARVRVVAPRHMAFLNALAIGILLFLFVDIVEHAVEPIEAAIAKDPADLPLLLLVLVGVFGGGPNFLGTIIGYTFSSAPVSVLFLSVAAGALVFVIGELFASGRKLNAPVWNGWGIGVGFFAGLLTDFVLIATGA